jgi:SAM-dependent methyltransferase
MLYEQLKIWRPFINDSINESSKILDLKAGKALEIGPSKGNPEQDPRFQSNPIYSFFKNFEINTACINTDWADYKLDICDTSSIPEALKEKYDLIFLIEVLEHTKHPWKAQESCFELLKKGGYLLISTPCYIDHHPGRYMSYGDYWRFLPKSHEILFDKFMLIKENVCAGNSNFPYGIFSIFRK